MLHLPIAPGATSTVNGVISCQPFSVVTEREKTAVSTRLNAISGARPVVEAIRWSSGSRILCRNSELDQRIILTERSPPVSRRERDARTKPSAADAAPSLIVAAGGAKGGQLFDASSES